jgi:hypothetical protein
MEQYLRAYINYQQDNWAQYLPLTKFATNNHVSKTTGLLPFFTKYGMHPKLDFEPDLRIDIPEEGQAQSLTQLLTEIHNFMKAEMTYTQDQQCEYADNYWIPALSYLLGDKV